MSSNAKVVVSGRFDLALASDVRPRGLRISYWPLPAAPLVQELLIIMVVCYVLAHTVPSSTHR